MNENKQLNDKNIELSPNRFKSVLFKTKVIPIFKFRNIEVWTEILSR